MDYYLKTGGVIFFIIASLWTLPWKGYALWKAARKGQPWWFVALLLVNTLGLLEIMYIFIFSGLAPKQKAKK